MSKYWENMLSSFGSLNDRLQTMNSEQVLSFAAGCAEHVLRHFIVVFDAAAPGESVSRFVTRCKEAQEQCWAVVAGVAPFHAMEGAIRRLDELFEDERLLEQAIDSGAHNIDELTASIYKSLECGLNAGHAGYAMGAANCAYNAVLQWYVSGSGETVEWTDKQSEQQQSECSYCQAEIRFQAGYLVSLENLGSGTPIYENVVNSML